MDTAPLIAGAIVITAPDGAVPVTGTMQFVATVTDASGNVIALAPVWSVSNGGGTIAADGLFTAGDSAATFVNTVTATSGAVSTTTSVTVSAGVLVTFKVTPDSTTLASAATQLFVAVGRDAHGNVAALSAPVTWTASSSSGTIDSAGMFTAGLLAGTFAKAVVATSGSLSDSATVVVLPGAAVSIQLDPDFAKMGVGDSVQFGAFGVDANRNRFAIAPVWTVVNGGGTITSTGLFVAGTIPSFYSNTVRAASGGLSATASLVEFPGSTVSITVTPDSVSIASEATQQFTAVGRDAFGNSTNPDVTWTVSGAGGSVDEDGLLTAGTVGGRYVVTARITQGTLSGSSTVIVTSSSLVRIVITPDNPTVLYRRSQQFTATGYDAANNVVPITGTPVWSLSDDIYGSIRENGVFRSYGGVQVTLPDYISFTNGTITAHATITLDCEC